MIAVEEGVRPALRGARVLAQAFAVGLPLTAVAGPSSAAPLPEPIRAMLAAAVRTHDPAVIAAVVSVAKQTAPDNAGEIDVLASQAKDPPSPAAEVAPPSTGEERHIAASRPWKGEVEIGGGRSTGASKTLRLYGAFDVSRITDAWTHRLTARADYQQTNGATTTERFAVAYQPQLKVNSLFYAYSLGQYEHDQSLGYRDRFTLGAGLGVAGVDRPALSISFDAGPALRRTNFYEVESEYALAGRGAIKVKWTPSARITLAQDLAVYLEGGNTTARSTTSMDTQIYGAIKARVSHNIQYERSALFHRRSRDTTSRASLIYRF